MKDRTLDKAYQKRQKELERRHISPLQRNAGAALIIAGLLFLVVGVFGYMVGDLQVGVSATSPVRCSSPAKRRRAPAPRFPVRWI